MKNALLFVVILLAASVAYAEDDDYITPDDLITTGYVGATLVGPKDPYRNLPCGEGPHTVYNLLIVECDADPWFSEQIQIGGKKMCRAYHAHEWTDWPRCEGRPITVISATAD